MHLVLCNERFLFRFGVDRVLLILAKLWRQQGHRVTLMGVTMDKEIAASIADQIIQIPGGDDYYQINEYVQSWLERNWDDVFEDHPPDAIINCGWPFFTSMPLFKEKAKGLIFHDYGIVPTYKYSGGTLKIQRKVRDLRKKYIKYSDYVITISDYITKTTYEVRPEDDVPVKTIHLGIDHMDLNLWNKDQLGNAAQGGVSEKIAALRQKGCQVILNLGRWETGHYKNSEAMYQLLRGLLADKVNCVMFVLGQKDSVAVPPDLKDKLIPLGFIDDAELIEAMKTCDLGVSSSLWEGFNLPMPEMQYYGRPVLAFKVGAHPEVVLHPWYLCSSVREMVAKAKKIFSGQDLPPAVREEAHQRFKAYFKWERCADLMSEVAEKVVSGQKYNIPLDQAYVRNGVKTVNIIMDMTNPANDPANPGIIRVCRRLAAQLQAYVNPIFVVWDRGNKEFVLPCRAEFERMSTYNGPRLLDEDLVSPDHRRITLDEYYEAHLKPALNWMLLPDIIRMDRGPDIRRYCLERGFKVAEIFYDDIPFRLTDIYTPADRDIHARYMIRLSDSDLVMTDSEYAASCLREFLGRLGLNHSRVKAMELPGELSSAPRVTQAPPPVATDCIQFTLISTLEPRKNHRQVIEACLMLEEKAPDLNFKFVMIGNRFAANPEIADYAAEISRTHKKIEWLGVVSDDRMKEVLQESAFTIYSSQMEGYGLPIMESLWQGKPCLCSKDGSMGELAAGGGCYTVDVNSPESIYKGLHKLCTDAQLRRRLTQEAVTRKIKTWDEYTVEVLANLFQTGSDLAAKQPLPDRKNEVPFLSSKPNMDEIPDEICRYLASAARKGGLALTLGLADQPTLKFIAEHYGLIFAFNEEVQPSPAPNIVCISGRLQDFMAEIAADLGDSHVKIDAVFAASSKHQGQEVKRLFKNNKIEADIPFVICHARS